MSCMFVFFSMKQDVLEQFMFSMFPSLGIPASGEWLINPPVQIVISSTLIE